MVIVSEFVLSSVGYVFTYWFVYCHHGTNSTNNWRLFRWYFSSTFYLCRKNKNTIVFRGKHISWYYLMCERKSDMCSVQKHTTLGWFYWRLFSHINLCFRPQERSFQFSSHWWYDVEISTQFSTLPSGALLSGWLLFQ